MTSRQDLLRSEKRPAFKPAAWLERIASVGIVTTDPMIARRQRFTNVAAFATAANAVSHLVINSIYAFDDLMIVHAYNTILAALALGATQLHRFGPNVAASSLVFVIIAGNLLVVFLFGSESTLHVYFTLAGAMLFMFGIEGWRFFLFWFAIACIALFASVHLVSEHGVVMEYDMYLRQMLSSHAMFNAIAINAVLIFYALAALRRAEINLGHEYARSEALIGAVMPAAIATRLKGGEQRIADQIENLSVLFADLVDFTAAARGLPPAVVVGYLDGLVRKFDALCEATGAEKIKTIGDCYVAVAGLGGQPGGTAACALGNLALAMQEAMRGSPALGARRLELRIGIHCGPAMAGIIGDVRFSYDVWGDAVNVASRMESHGSPGGIHVSDAFRDLTADAFVFEDRGVAEVKGLGTVHTYFLVETRAPNNADHQ